MTRNTMYEQIFFLNFLNLKGEGGVGVPPLNSEHIVYSCETQCRQLLVYFNFFFLFFSI